MIDIPLLDELREIRRRLSVASKEDAIRYAQMLQDDTQTLPGTRVFKPLLPPMPARSDSRCLAEEKPISP
jgi:hypothetical protein